ncbi:MAG: hypothetical protein RMI94_08560 [Bryobacterales bacterium]|nr:hypothetical protein [Bryobacterales bacterium]
MRIPDTGHPTRRGFLQLALAGFAAPWSRVRWSEQKVHPDYQTRAGGTEYFLTGNGKLAVALQSADPETGLTQGGLLLMSAERMTRKHGTLLFRMERGVRNSRLALRLERSEYVPEAVSAEVRWEHPGRTPTIVQTWPAGACLVEERLWCPSEEAALIREVFVQNRSQRTVSPVLVARLDANHALFDEFEVDGEGGSLTARGYEELTLFALEGRASAGERHLEVPIGELPPGGRAAVTLVLALGPAGQRLRGASLSALRARTAQWWSSRAWLASDRPALDHLFRVTLSGLRATVAASGKMDGSIWQYNMEWVRDQTMAALGAIAVGHVEVARAILERILTRSVTAEGSTVEASRFRPPDDAELDQNGELLYTVWFLWAWTGEDELLRRHWSRLRAAADYLLAPQFRFHETGLLGNVREYWERDARYGVLPGYELSYQVWAVLGLTKAAEMARHVGDEGAAARWLSASARIRETMLAHPRLGFIVDGRLIKRRLVTGAPQRVLEPPDRTAMPPGMPLRVEPAPYCDPDSTLALPVAFELVDPGSALAANTLEALETLWNQRWDFGGYGRYHVASEPDSPGPWPFASLFIARANLEAGRDDRVWRVLEWLLSIPGGRAGAWFEHYGDRPVPPLPPVGITPWTWGELGMLLVHHMLGVRPDPSGLIIRPRLLDGVNQAEATLCVHGRRVHLRMQRGKHWRAQLEGRSLEVVSGAVKLPAPREDMEIEFELPGRAPA